MSKKIRWLCVAVADLDQLMDHIAKDNPRAANEVAREIWESTQMLSGQPAIGRAGRVPGTRELVVSGTHYIVPYCVVAEEVQILRVIHATRKWPDRF
jgi:toxin ParE1/3/4